MTNVVPLLPDVHPTAMPNSDVGADLVGLLSLGIMNVTGELKGKWNLLSISGGLLVTSSVEET